MIVGISIASMYAWRWEQQRVLEHVVISYAMCTLSFESVNDECRMNNNFGAVR